VTPDELAELLQWVLGALDEAVEGDWSKPAGTLEWTCFQTIDHVIDCVFSYSMQVAARAPSGFLPFSELHALPSATPRDLISGLRAVGAMFLAVVRESPADTLASDGVVELDLWGWCSRAAYEIALHGHDVLSGLGSNAQLPVEICRSIVDDESLWMFDRDRARGAPDPVTALLLGAGRAVAG
jgi:hypothetical protein